MLQALYRPALRIPGSLTWTAAAVATRPTMSSRHASSSHQVRVPFIQIYSTQSAKQLKCSSLTLGMLEYCEFGMGRVMGAWIPVSSKTTQFTLSATETSEQLIADEQEWNLMFYSV